MANSKFKHGARVVCTNLNSAWYGHVGVISNMRSDGAGVRFETEARPPATGRWIKKIDLASVEEASEAVQSAMLRIQQVHSLVKKARESTEGAIAAYNRPGIAFRTPSFVVLMVIAWTSALLARFLKNSEDPWYTKNGKIEMVDGASKMWSPIDCVRKTFINPKHPVRANLEFIIKIRDNIEHAFCPDLDEELFGEAQAMVLNLNEFLRQEFGEENCLDSALPFSIQIAGRTTPAQTKVWKDWFGPEVQRLMKAVSDYRNDLPDEVWGDPRYRYRVLLIPTVANNERNADVAVRFIHFDPSDPTMLDVMTQIAAIIKPRTVEVTAANALRPAAVASEVQERIGFRFRVTPEHSRLWKHYQVRPANHGDADGCKKEYCFWFAATKEYLYTKEWVDLLVQTLSEPENWLRILGCKPIPIPSS